MRISIFPSMLAAAVMAVATPLQAQNEAMLRQAFEGKVVAVKIDMSSSPFRRCVGRALRRKASTCSSQEPNTRRTPWPMEQPGMALARLHLPTV